LTTGQFEKYFENFCPSRVADVMTTFNSGSRLAATRFNNPSNMSLPKREEKSTIRGINILRLYMPLLAVEDDSIQQFVDLPCNPES
jgi:hypothetical protein